MTVRRFIAALRQTARTQDAEPLAGFLRSSDARTSFVAALTCTTVAAALGVADTAAEDASAFCATLAGQFLQRYHDSLAEAAAEPSAQNGRAAAVQALSAALRAFDPNLHERGRLTAALAARIAVQLGFDRQQTSQLEECAQLHEIGALRVSRDASQSPCGEQAVHGAQILSESPALLAYVPIVRAHLERFDGSGYPDGLRADAIPLASRIIAVASTFTAALQERSGSQTVSPREVLDGIVRAKGSAFDPLIVDTLCELVSTPATIAHAQSKGLA